MSACDATIGWLPSTRPELRSARLWVSGRSSLPSATRTRVNTRPSGPRVKR
jgi:hypothetical protein